MHTVVKVLSITLVLGGADIGQAYAETITLKVWATPSIFKGMFEKLTKGFEAKYPDIKIALDASNRSQEDIVQSVLKQAIVGGLPDVSFQGPNYLRTIADRGAIVPIDEMLASDPDWTADRFSPSLANSAKVNGKVYGISIASSVPVIFYNADLVRKAQGDAPLPETWDGIVELAAKISALDKGLVGGFHRTDSLFFQAQINARGGVLMNDAETKIAFTEQPGLEAMRFMKRLGEAGQGRNPMSRDQARQAFAGGTVGMLTDMSSGISARVKQIGDKFRMGVAAFPVPANQGGLPSAGLVATVSTKDKARQKAAWAYIKYIAEVEGQEIVGAETSYFPGNNVALQTSSVLKTLVAEQPLIQPALKTVPLAVAWYAFPGENAAKIDDLIGASVEAVSTLRMAPEAGLAKMKADVEGLLPK